MQSSTLLVMMDPTGSPVLAVTCSTQAPSAQQTIQYPYKVLYSNCSHLNKVSSRLVGPVSQGAALFNRAILKSLISKARARREALKPGYAAQPAHNTHEGNHYLIWSVLAPNGLKVFACWFCTPLIGSQYTTTGSTLRGSRTC